MSIPIRLRAYPQKLVEHFKSSAPEVPQAARSGSTLRVGGLRGVVWEGSTTGLVRTESAAPIPLDRVQHFRGRRYLADDAVQHIHLEGGSVWARTATGVSRMELRPMTLLQKASSFEDRIRLRHDRYGMVASSRLVTPGDYSTNATTSSDNDGLWTAMYGAAECFRYAVTKSPDALALARRATEAVLFLEEVTARPGYPARSFIKKGDVRDPGGVWHWTPDGSHEWKSDTSSDEIVGHFFLFGIAYDLLPDPALRGRIYNTARRIMDHIVAHGYNLTDIHGQPTYWGRWSPEYFGTRRGLPDAPLNALELLSFLLTTFHITGENRYRMEYGKVAHELGYIDWTTRLAELRRQVNYSDEELAMLPFYLVFRYELEPAALARYRDALDQWWQNIRRENNPLWTFIYQTAKPDADIDLAAAVHTLYRIPMDLRNWAVDNSHRADIDWEPAADRFGRRQARNFIPPDERPVMKWNGNPFVVNGGGNGGSEDDGAFFLLPYWMGRYHRLLLGQ